MHDPLHQLFPPEPPPNTPPQLKLLLDRLNDAMVRDQVDLARAYLWASLEQLIRFFSGLTLEALDYEGLRTPTQLSLLTRGAGSLEGCTRVLQAAVGGLVDPPRTRRGEQVLKVFYPYPPLDALHTRWLGIAGAPTEQPPLYRWTPTIDHVDIQAEAVRNYLPILHSWLIGATPLFAEELFSLDREQAVTLVHEFEPPPVQAGPPNPDDALAYWSQMEASAEDARMAAQQVLLALSQRAEGALSRNLFEIAAQEFGRILERQADAAALAGKGRALSCLGRLEEAQQCLTEAEELSRQFGDPSSRCSSLFYRATNLRYLGRLQEALEDIEPALVLAREQKAEPTRLAAMEMERAAILHHLGQRAAYLQALKRACEDSKRAADVEKSSRVEVELACNLVERAYATDPSFKDHRARSDRNQAIAILKKLKKREPLFAMDIELVRFVMERFDPWGRPEQDLLSAERDLRVIRVLLELLPPSDELKALQVRLMEEARQRLSRGPLPAGYVAQLFGLFTDLAARSGKESRRWQTEHWLELAESFPDHDNRTRCLVLACSSLHSSPESRDVKLLVSLLDRLADELPQGLPSGGLDLLGPAFSAIQHRLPKMGREPDFKASVQAMAERWRALPPTMPSRAGVGRQVLSELAGKKIDNVTP
ncbi:tetratricopeptide repeat protein [bacterium CPR1]|nr:tetratricopeptide repeat protein [bacterium CPR1]